MTGCLFPFKLTVVPLLIWLISYSGRKWGPVAAGSLSAFPVVVGPALLFMALENGKDFASSAAAGSVSAHIPHLICLVFCIFLLNIFSNLAIVIDFLNLP